MRRKRRKTGVLGVFRPPVSRKRLSASLSFYTIAAENTTVFRHFSANEEKSRRYTVFRPVRRSGCGLGCAAAHCILRRKSAACTSGRVDSRRKKGKAEKRRRTREIMAQPAAFLQTGFPQRRECQKMAGQAGFEHFPPTFPHPSENAEIRFMSSAA